MIKNFNSVDAFQKYLNNLASIHVDFSEVQISVPKFIDDKIIKFNNLLTEFNKTLDIERELLDSDDNQAYIENKKRNAQIYNDLTAIVHPSSHYLTILKIQMTGFSN